ncbi:hypothetical protein QBC46DRAFT_412359 [Diplogelasinospora grovesii]|uniref:Uncharacterized protein n=1 Tax=Diplogelasinospora grovesii TaxID=303347 RepID=A0AAN6S143_9PEZI|nr:hypothetical protein QBC46DRAFT_412359 [Diplogelasinospora grovesii]
MSSFVQMIICTRPDSDFSADIVTTSILIGRIIEGFEVFMARANPLSSPTRPSTMSSISESTSGVSVPRLSWGGLQMEPDEEAELKKHMWLMQLRKLQRVIKKLSVTTTGPRDSGNSTHLMIHQCIHMWLAQKVECLKDCY